jgi:hypothetical protein
MGIISNIRESIRTAKSRYYEKKREELKKDLNLEQEAKEVRKLKREKEIVAKSYRPKETKFDKIKKTLKQITKENKMSDNVFYKQDSNNPFTAGFGENIFYPKKKR